MIALRLEGGAKLAAELEKISKRASKSVMRDALTTVVAMPIQARASSLAPVDPGAPDIASNIVISNGRARGSAVAVLVGPSTGAREDQPKTTYDRQGSYLEHGTSDTPMQPFMRPAFDSEAPRSLSGLASAMWHALISRGFASTRGSGGGGGLL